MTNPTEAATFRLDKAILDALRREAEEKQISLSTLINQIARSHVEWHVNATRAGFMPIRKKVIQKFFDSLTNDKIDSLADQVSKGLIDDIMMFMSIEPTEELTFEFMERWLKYSGFNYHYEITSDNKSRIFVVQHNMGKNWSYYLSKIGEHIASNFTNVRPDIQLTENAIFMRIRKNSEDQ